MYARDEAIIATPIGTIRLTSDGSFLTSVSITRDSPIREPSVAVLEQAKTEMNQWLAGERTGFSVPLAPSASARSQILRDAIAAINYGETLSYGALARKIGSGARAIGQACARNPFPIIIPCHRVLAAQGKLGAYSGGEGPVTKLWLLDFERKHRPD
jgi:methylated-DNA-[protein]-cysteine S-methyltransferase